MTTLLDANNLEPPSRKLLYAISGVILVILLGLGLWYLLRFEGERRTIVHFMDAVVAGDLDQAYRIWKPHGSYSKDDFLGDWAPKGYYGPIESYRIQGVQEPPNGASGVIVTVEISPMRPFPDEKDPQSSKTREVRLWVERSDRSIGFPP